RGDFLLPPRNRRRQPRSPPPGAQPEPPRRVAFAESLVSGAGHNGVSFGCLPVASSARRLLPSLLFVAAAASAALLAQSPLPNKPDSLKFAAMGDNGTGDRAQLETAEQMVKTHAAFPFDLVIMLGDNMYGGQSPADFVKKFEQPYGPLLTA